jgi:hypothetical protein
MIITPSASKEGLYEGGLKKIHRDKVIALVKKNPLSFIRNEILSLIKAESV